MGCWWDCLAFAVVMALVFNGCYQATNRFPSWARFIIACAIMVGAALFICRWMDLAMIRGQLIGGAP